MFPGPVPTETPAPGYHWQSGWNHEQGWHWYQSNVVIALPDDLPVEVVADPFSSNRQPDYLIRNFNHRPDRPHDYRNAEEEFG